MPGIAIGNCIPFNRGGVSWSSYWATHSPSGLIVTTYDTSIKLDWTDGAEAPDGIRVYVDTVEVDTVAHGVQTYTITGLTELTEYDISVVGYSGSNESTALTNTTTTYRYRYVRPLGGAYGDEDGSSYANAWNGFADISWAAVVPNTVLWICGTHSERCNFAASGTAALPILIRGDYPTDPGVLDGLDSVTHLLFISGCNYTETHKLTILRAVTTCYEAGQGNHWVYDCDITDSGDQNIECRDGAILRIYRTNILRAGDDGISMHLSGTIIVDDCEFDDNVQDHIGSAGGAGITVTNTRFGEAPYGINTDCVTNISRCSFVTSGSILANGSNDDLSTLAYCFFNVNGFGFGENMFDAINLIVDNGTFIGTNTAGTVARVGYKQKFRNCIFYDIGRMHYYFAGATDADHETINCNFYSLGTKDLRANTGEIAGDPLFTNAAADDFTLQAGSPCRGVGVTGLGYTTDLAGNTVPATGVDIGCYQNS